MKILTLSFNKPLYRKRQADKIVTGWSLAKKALTAIGHEILDYDAMEPDFYSLDVDWDLVLVYVDDPRGRTSGHALKALEFMTLAKQASMPVATYIGNARFDEIILGLRYAARNLSAVEREKPNGWYSPANTFPVMEAAAAPLPNLMVHAFPWNDFGVFERLAGYRPDFIWDPTPISCPFLPLSTLGPREQVWADSNLRAQKAWWKVSWPVEEHRSTPEAKLYERYAQVEGVLTQRYWAFPTAWWRHRFVMALDAGAFLGIHQEEGTNMGREFMTVPGKFEDLNPRERRDLADAQRAWFFSHTWSSEQVYEAFAQFMRRF